VTDRQTDEQYHSRARYSCSCCRGHLSSQWEHTIFSVWPPKNY